MIGTAKTVLVFDLGGVRKAIITSIQASISKKRLKGRVSFLGPVALNAESQTQIRTIIINIIDRMTKPLGIKELDFEICITNPGVSSVNDTGLEIAGYSAELPVFLAMLSAALQIPIPQDMVATGHLASTNGDIAPVSGLIEKLKASIADTSIRKFMYPDLKRDQSLKALTPVELKETELALATKQEFIELCPVKNIAKAIALVFSEEEIILGSLVSGYFNADLSKDGNDGPIDQALVLLSAENEARFWRILESNLLDNEINRSRTLLDQFAWFYISSKEYPAGFGEKLYHLLVSLPPMIRKNRKLYPLITIKNYLQLAQLAKDDDFSDLQKLFSCNQETIHGGKYHTEPSDDKKSVPEQPDSILQYFLKALTPPNIAEEILLPIDQARAAYNMDRIQIDSYDEFTESIISFYTHLLLHLNQIKGITNKQLLAPDALDLLNRTFQEYGGIKAAYEESRSAVKGGLRYIFDKMTERLKAEEREKFIRMVFKSLMDPLNFEMKVALIEAFFKRLGSSLPEDIRSRPPEQYATDYEIIVRTYAESLEKMIDTLRII